MHQQAFFQMAWVNTESALQLKFVVVDFLFGFEISLERLEKNFLFSPFYFNLYWCLISNID